MLRAEWSDKTPETACIVLARPDIAVTNGRDRQVQLPRLARLHELAKRVYASTNLVATALVPSPRDGTSSGAPPPRPPFTHSAFLSHDWGVDELGRSNHERVRRVADALKAVGYKPWLDEHEMHGNIDMRMAEGIEKSECIIIFVTRNYMDKASGSGVSRQRLELPPPPLLTPPPASL